MTSFSFNVQLFLIIGMTSVEKEQIKKGEIPKEWQAKPNKLAQKDREMLVGCSNTQKPKMKIRV